MYKAVAVVAALVLLSSAACGGKNRDYLIVGDESIGGFPQNGTVAKALEVFGHPARRTYGFDTCRLRWPSRGIAMESYYLNSGAAGPNPCGPKGRHHSTTVTGRRWHTSAGLQIGDSLAKLRQLYPKARLDRPHVWQLMIRNFVGLPFTGLGATVRNGRVTAFTLYGPPI